MFREDVLSTFDIFMDGAQLGVVLSFIDGTRLLMQLAQKGYVHEMLAVYETMQNYGFSFESHALVLERMLFALARERHASGVHTIAAELDSMMIPLGDASYERLVHAYFSIGSDDRAFKLLDTYRAAGAPVSRLIAFALYSIGSISSARSDVDFAERALLADRLPRKILEYLVASPSGSSDEIAALLCHEMRFGKDASVLVEALSMRTIVERASPVLLEACLAFLLMAAHTRRPVVHGNNAASIGESPYARLTLQEFADGAQLPAATLRGRSHQLLDFVWPGEEEELLAAAEEEIASLLSPEPAIRSSPPLPLSESARIGAGLDARVILDAEIATSTDELLSRRLEALYSATGLSFVAPPLGGFGSKQSAALPLTDVKRAPPLGSLEFTNTLEDASSEAEASMLRSQFSTYAQYAVSILLRLEAQGYTVHPELQLATFQQLAAAFYVLPAAQLARRLKDKGLLLTDSLAFDRLVGALRESFDAPDATAAAKWLAHHFLHPQLQAAYSSFVAKQRSEFGSSFVCALTCAGAPEAPPRLEVRVSPSKLLKRSDRCRFLTYLSPVFLWGPFESQLQEAEAAFVIPWAVELPVCSFPQLFSLRQGRASGFRDDDERGAATSNINTVETSAPSTPLHCEVGATSAEARCIVISEELPPFSGVKKVERAPYLAFQTKLLYKADTYVYK